MKECSKAPLETFIISEILKEHDLKYIENSGFFEYAHGVWTLTPENRIKAYISDALGNYATGGRMSSICGHLQAMISSEEVFNTQMIYNFPNGVLDLETGELKEHSRAYYLHRQCCH